MRSVAFKAGMITENRSVIFSSMLQEKDECAGESKLGISDNLIVLI